jgi:hypothetical protein
VPAENEIAREQDHLRTLYDLVDAQRAETAERLAVLTAPDPDADPQDRRAELTWTARQATRLASAEQGLCFGRLDGDDGVAVHIGRIGLFRDDSGDDDGQDTTLLLDWRAPAARPFYTATPLDRQGVRRRRRITTRERTVVGLDDELLVRDGDGGDGTDLAGEAALLAAVTAGRSGRMRDVVATLQAEQDRIVRSGQLGVLVVEGGPGTGKTAVALHRAAYLLYTHRHLLDRGVLVIGPSRVFLDYIGQVLPGLGEDGVVSATVADLYPGIALEHVDDAPARVLKGAATMAYRLAAAVRARIAPTAVEVEFEGQQLRLERADVRRAARVARRAGLPHNHARRVFERELVGALAGAVVAGMEAVVLDADGRALDGGAADGRLSAADLRALESAGVVVGADEAGPVAMVDETDLAALRSALLVDPAVGALVDRMWPELAPEPLLTELLADPAAAWPDLSPAEATALRRTGGGRSAADVPLLDELAALIGRGAPAADPDGPTGPLAERAGADPGWVFGHVVVDEAQELSEMAWRMLVRRCPSRSMTVVGDPAQAGDPAAAPSWEAALGERFERVRLTVNYRTPAEIMDAAEAVLAAHPAARPAGARAVRSIRAEGSAPWRLHTTPAELAGRVAAVAEGESAELDRGRVAVIATADRLPELAEALDRPVEPDPRDPVALFTPELAKGLEFDVVVVVDPAAIVAGSARGANDLYVAMTRATHRLCVVHAGPPPAGLAELPEHPR